MSSSSAYRFLEQLQAATHRNLGIPVPDRKMEAAAMEQAAVQILTTKLSRAPSREEVLELFQAADDQAVEPPTRYEDPKGFQLLIGLNGYIEKVLAESKVQLPARPHFGTLATGRVNAVTIAVPGGDHLILLERGLFHFALLISKALALAFPVTGTDPQGKIGFSMDPDDVARHLDTDHRAVDRFTEAVLAYVLTGEPGDAPPYILDAWDYQTLSVLFRDALELFVIGHEYGHLIGGHLTSARRRAAALPAGTIPAEELEFAWGQEAEADITGVQLGAAAMLTKHGNDLGFGFCGFEVFFSSMDIMDKAVSLVQFGDESARILGTHPPNDQRRQLLRAAVTEILGEERSASPLGMGKMIESAFDALWQRASDSLMRLHQAGRRPAPMWSTALTKPT